MPAPGADRLTICRGDCNNLDGDDLGDGACSGKLPLRDVRHADMADLTVALEVDERTDPISLYPVIDRM